MIDTDFFGYKREENGTYTIMKNGESFLRGIVDSMEAAKIVESLLKDERENKE